MGGKRLVREPVHASPSWRHYLGRPSVVAGLFPLTNKKSISILQAASSIRITTVYGGYFSISFIILLQLRYTLRPLKLGTKDRIECQLLEAYIYKTRYLYKMPSLLLNAIASSNLM